MTNQAYARLIGKLDRRFRELDLFLTHMPSTHLKYMLRGEVMCVVVDQGGDHLVTWVSPTKKPLDRLFTGSV